MTEKPKPSLERGRIFRNRLGSTKDYETRTTNKIDGAGHGAKKADNEYGKRLQPGKIETGEACIGCKRIFKTIRGVKQHQRLTKCLEKYQADRIYKSKVGGIQEKHHSDTDNRLPVTRPLSTSDGAITPKETNKDKDVSPNQSNTQAEDNHPSPKGKKEDDNIYPGKYPTGIGAEETDLKDEETKLGEMGPKNLKTKLWNQGEEEDAIEPVEEFSILPGITVKTYSQDKKGKCKGSRFYREFRNSHRKSSRAIDQGDIRLWAKTSVNSKPEAVKVNKAQEGKEKQITPEPTPEPAPEPAPELASEPTPEPVPETFPEERNTGLEPSCHEQQLQKPKLKSVVFKVNDYLKEASLKPGPKKAAPKEDSERQQLFRHYEGKQ